MARRPKPFGRDRLGILGGPTGAVGALSDTDSEYRIGTNDFIIESTFRVNRFGGNPIYNLIMDAIEDAQDIRLTIRATTSKLRLQVGTTNYDFSISDYYGKWIHVVIFGDRDGSAYVYWDGAYLTAQSIAAESASDITSDDFRCFGRLSTDYDQVDGQLARLFVLSGAFPTAGEMAAIARERFLNPDAESPTLAARANYATERRVDVDFADERYMSTTIQNRGTGSDFTIGGGLACNDVLVHAERSAIMKPEDDWYALDYTHEATNAAADVGFIAGGSYICEMLIYNIKDINTVTDNLMEIDPAGSADHFRYRTGGVSNWVETVASAYTINAYFTSSLAPRKYLIDGLAIVHLTVDRAGTRMENIYFNGSKHMWSTNAFGTMNLSGDCAYKFGDSSTWDGLMARRVWCAAADMPADLDAQIYQRVINPWAAPSTLAGLTLMVNHECRIDASVSQGAASTLLKNLVSPGTADLTLSGAGTLGASVIKCVSGR